MLHSRRDLAASPQAPHTIRPRLWRSEPATSRIAPFISVLVPVRNESRFIGPTLLKLLHQRYDASRYEVIVADGESDDDTAEQVRALQLRYPNLHLVSNPSIWSSAGRNAALEAARGEIIVVVDGHSDLDNADYLGNLADAFERSGADCVGRPQPLNVAQATAVQKAIAACRATRLGHHPASFIYSSGERFVKASSVAVAYRREVFETVGPFDEDFDACEDVEFNHRADGAGFRCFFTPRVQLRYHPRGTLTSLVRQMIRYGRGRVRLLRKHRDTFTLAGFVPALFVLGILFGPLFGLLSPWLMGTYLGCLCLYAALVLLTSLSVAWRDRDLRLLPLAPLVFLAVHGGAGAGILLECLRPGKPPAARRNPAVQPETVAPRRAA
jgi:succinoglycan biosynthesis protein ExoA